MSKELCAECINVSVTDVGMQNEPLLAEKTHKKGGKMKTLMRKPISNIILGRIFMTTAACGGGSGGNTTPANPPITDNTKPTIYMNAPAG